MSKTEKIIELDTSNPINNNALFLSWKSYLKKYKTTNEYNVLSLDKGKYFIPDDEYKDFLNEYKKYLEKGTKLCIVEKQLDIGPLVIDLDYEYSIKPNNLLEITKEISEKVKEMVKEDYVILCKSYEKDIKNGKKQGYHVQFPLTSLNIDCKIIIFNEIRKIIKKYQNLFINTPKKILDESVISKNGWLLFGSMKNDDTEYYKIVYHTFNELPDDLITFLSVKNKKNETKITTKTPTEYESDSEEEIKQVINNDNNLEDIILDIIDEIKEHFVIWNLDKIIKIKKVKNRIFVNMDEEYCYFIERKHKRSTSPFYLDISEKGVLARCYDEDCTGKHYPSKPINYSNELKEKLFGVIEMDYENNIVSKNETKFETKFETVLMEMRKQDCFKNNPLIPDPNTNEIIIKDAGGNQEILIPLSDKYCPINKKNLDISKILGVIKDDRFWLKLMHIYGTQYPETPIKITNNFYKPIININVNIVNDDDEPLETDYDIAKNIFNLKKEQYNFNELENGTWYQWNENRWINGNDTLKIYMSEDLCKIYQTEKNKCKVSEKNKIKQLDKIINKLKTSASKTSILKEASTLFYNHNKHFTEKLNQNKFLLGFENGVLDLEKCIFRKAEPNDFISFSTKINFKEKCENEELILFLQQIMPIPEHLEYLLAITSLCLEGNSGDNSFYIFTGSGGNGKSKYINLVESVFGEYSFTLPISFLTQKRTSSNQANPELINSIGKRFGKCQEPNNDPDNPEKINVGIMKEITGCDKLTCRGLYKGQIEFNPMFRLFLACNDLPDIPANDDGTWRRVKVIPFSSKFVENPTKTNEFKIDKNLDNKMKNWKEDFMALLWQYYQEYKHKDIIVPDEFINVIKKYRFNSNPILEFFDENYEITTDDNNYVIMNEVYTKYKKYTGNTISKIAFSKEIYKLFKIKSDLKRVHSEPETIYMKVKEKEIN